MQETVIRNAKPLKIQNLNNKFDQDEFIEIHYAPPRASFNKDGVYRGVFLESDFENTVYVIDNNGSPVFVKLTGFARVLFKNLLNEETQAAAGLNSYYWRCQFMMKYPKTTMDSEMAIYYYKKVK